MGRLPWQTVFGKRYCAMLVWSLLASGCATYQQTSSGHLRNFKQGHSAEAIAYFSSNQRGNNTQLHMAEAGRLKMLEGDFRGSHDEFRRLIDAIFDVREGAMIRLKDVGGAALSATFLDDRIAPYNLPAFESVLAFQYQAINSLFLGDIEAAAVEARRAVAAQDLVAARYENQVVRARREAQDSFAQAGMQAVNNYYAQLGPVLGRAKTGFQNPFVWYFSGIMYEVQGEPDNAYIAYKKAWELAPDNVWLQRDLLRLAARQNPEEWAGFKQNFVLPSIDSDAGTTAAVIIFYEEGVISQRYSEAIRVFLGDRAHSVTFPVYRDAPYQPLHVRATLRSGVTIGALMPLAYYQSLAYHDLQERVPGIAARNILRAMSRELAREVARQSDNAWINLAYHVGAGVASLADEADTRGWYSLPMGVQMLRAPVPAGTHTLQLHRAGLGAPLEIPLQTQPGEKKLVWVADMGGRISIGVTSFTHARVAKTQFERHIGAVGAGAGSLADKEQCAGRGGQEGDRL